MRISALSDIHYPEIDLDEVSMQLHQQDPDVIVAAGDLMNRFTEEAAATIACWLKAQKRHVVVALGNHDVWNGDRNAYTTRDYLIEVLASDHVHVVDKEYAKIGDITFWGGMGWYDYSFFQADLFPLDEFYSHPDFRRWYCLEREDFKRILVKENQKKWSEMNEEDLERRIIGIRVPPKVYSAHWHDKDEVSWSPKEFCASELERMREQRNSITGKNVAVIHHVPFSEALGLPRSPVEGYTAAFMGSKSLGELVKAADLVIHGHNHKNRTYSVEGTTVENVYAIPRVIEV